MGKGIVPDASTYIGQWQMLAIVAGVLAGVSLIVGIFGIWQAWLTLREVLREPLHTRTMGIVSWGDFVVMIVLTFVAVVQVGTSWALVWLSDKYPDALLPVLLILDGNVTTAYLGYALQVALGTLGVTSYQLFRLWALKEERRRSHR